MRWTIAIAFCSFLLLPTVAGAQQPDPEPGTAESIGRRIDRGLNDLGRELREGWAEMRRSLNELGVQGRVYSRLRWDKGINIDSIAIEVRETDIVILSGSVPDEAMKRKAVQLAEDTVGVRKVTDQLLVDPPGAGQQPPAR